MMTPDKGLVLFVLIDFLQAVFGDEHSLLYRYTIQSKSSDSNIYTCTAVTLLNNTQIDFYNSSSDQSRTPKHNWLNNIPEPDRKTSTEKLQYDTKLLQKLITMQMKESGDSESGDHVLQWRHGYVGERGSDGSVTVLNSINELGYDGEDLIHFNCNSWTWLTPEKKNREREEKWNKLYRYTGIKNCEQCEEMLKMYLKYSITDITPSNTPPAVHVFSKKSVRDSSKLTLTCLATGFYPKDVEMKVRKSTTEIPEHLLTSSGVRPNDDGTYQLRKSVEIPEDDSAEHYCYVSHSSLTEPVIKEWHGRCANCSINTYLELIIVLEVVVSLCYVILCVLRIIRENGRFTNCSNNIYRRLTNGLWGLVAVCIVILCVLMIVKRVRCSNCPNNIYRRLFIGGLVSSVVMGLSIVIYWVLNPIRKCARRREANRHKAKEQIFLSGGAGREQVICKVQERMSRDSDYGTESDSAMNSSEEKYLRSDAPGKLPPLDSDDSGTENDDEEAFNEEEFPDKILDEDSGHEEASSEEEFPDNYTGGRD